MIRDRGDDWNIDRNRVGGVGFSAGAHFMVELAGQHDRAARPAFVGAIYGPPLEWVVPHAAPPLFVAAAADDPLFDGSVGVHAAWRAAGRPAEAHLYERGGHGFGMLRQGSPSDHWIEQFHEWLMSRPPHRIPD